MMIDKGDEERIRRKEALDSAIASTEMEGFKFTQSEKEDFDKIVNGTMTFEEHRQKYIEIGGV